jgi:uncharacterized protein (DUF2147 family)
LVPEKAERVDEKNPNPVLRKTKLWGMEIFRNFKFDGKKNWDGGLVYIPKRGKTYHAYLELKNPDLLVVTGYIVFKALGRSEMFERVK